MDGFQPLDSLWAGSNPPYPSEHSARWELRKLRERLTQERAIALHRGRILVHSQRFAEVAQEAAIDQFAKRFTSHSRG